MADFLRNLLLVAAGGALGSAARYLCLLAGAQLGWSAAWSVAVINLGGSFALGSLVPLVSLVGYAPKLLSPGGSQGVWLFLAVGVLGGYTTFSAFSLNLMETLQRGETLQVLFNIVGSVIGGMLCAFLGFYLTSGLLKV